MLIIVFVCASSTSSTGSRRGCANKCVLASLQNARLRSSSRLEHTSVRARARVYVCVVSEKRMVSHKCISAYQCLSCASSTGSRRGCARRCIFGVTAERQIAQQQQAGLPALPQAPAAPPTGHVHYPHTPTQAQIRSTIHTTHNAHLCALLLQVCSLLCRRLGF